MIEYQQLASIAEALTLRSLPPVPHFHLLHNVLDSPESDPRLRRGHNAISNSRWVQLLVQEQWDDGSWGRPHSRDTSRKQRIQTTEIGVLRGVALGLNKQDPTLAKASEYLQSVLRGDVGVCDPPESNDRWRTGMRLFTAATLAVIAGSACVGSDLGPVV